MIIDSPQTELLYNSIKSIFNLPENLSRYAVPLGKQLFLLLYSGACLPTTYITLFSSLANYMTFIITL